MNHTNGRAPTDLCVGVIGLGSMGSGVAESLMRNGFSTVGYDISPAARERFELAGGTIKGIDELLASCDVTIILLLNEEQARDALTDGSGALRHIKSGGVVICCSTVSIEFITWCGAILATNDIKFLDAPVSGGPVRAAAGTLVIYLAGDPAAIAKAQPVLNAISDPLFVISATLGHGTSFKLVNQILAAGNLVVASQAAAFAEAMDLDLQQVLDVVEKSAGNSWILQNIIPRHIDRNYEPRSALGTFLKDVKIINKVSRDRAIHNPVSVFVEEVLQETSLVEGYLNLDGAVVAKHLSEASATK